MVSKNAVSARWVANRITNAVRNNADIDPERLVKTRGTMQSWLPGAISRAADNIRPDKTGYPGRSKAIQALNEYVGRARTSADKLPQMVPNIAGFPINPINRLTPHYNPGTRKIQPGSSWSTALHEYGHAMDHIKSPDAFGDFKAYAQEVRANRNASIARKAMQDSQVAVPGARQMHQELRPAIETYRLNSLRNLFAPMRGRNALKTYPPTHRTQRALWDRFIEPRLADPNRKVDALIDTMNDWDKQVRPTLDVKSSPVPSLRDLRTNWRIG